ncbi:MAG: ATP-binding protein [Candidatus Schekmanbacteria bacterium]|nr:ATP-binding protein [Candidatus Schekmanbacteria bacterium]
MPRFFNTAGPCDPEDHFMLPAEHRLPSVRELIVQKLYFVVHAPRQSGKTTCLRAFARALTSEGRHAAVLASCEAAQPAGGDLDRGIAALLSSVEFAAQRLPEALRPLPPEALAGVPAETRLIHYLTRWAAKAPLPVVLFLDEIDALLDETLLSVLRQLRAGYGERPDRFPQSIGLIGLRDVRDYKVRIRPESASLGTSSPFNVKVRSLRLSNFTPDEVAALLVQHTAETGQRFEPDALSLAWELTRGQPWLVNALARQVVEDDVRDRSVAVTRAHVEAAKDTLILRRDTHLDSLADKLREERVRRVIEPVLAGDLPDLDRYDDDAAYVEDLGLIERRTGAPPRIANPIYHEVIPRALAFAVQESLPQRSVWYVGADGLLLTTKLLDEFQAFWRQHAEPLLRQQPYPEAAPHLIFFGFLQRIVNGGGTVDREYAVGSGRMDLCVRWRHPGGEQREAFEIKVWRDKRADPQPEGLDQLADYLVRLGLEHGALLLFDRRSTAPPLAERCSSQQIEHRGKSIRVLRL